MYFKGIDYIDSTNYQLLLTFYDVNTLNNIDQLV